MDPKDIIDKDVLTPSYWERLLEKVYELMITKGIDIATAILILVIGFFLIGKIAKGIRLAIIRRTDDIAVGEFVEQTARIVMKIMLFLSVASQMGVETTSFVAALGAAGLAIGMALQGSLSNFAGGVLILVFKPFRVGDTIDSLGFSGEVVKIDILHTKLLTGDNRLVVLPNGQVANSSLVNASNQKRRRSEFLIHVDYQQDIQKVRQIIIKELNKDERIYNDPVPTVIVNNLGEANIQLLTRFWTDNGQHSAALAQALESVKRAFQHEGIPISPGPQKIEIVK